VNETAELSRAVDLIGRLLLKEIDADMLAQLRSGPVCEALAALDLALPDDADVEGLAAEYCAAFIGPVDHVPLIQSVHVGDGLESPSANAVRRIATAAGLELDRDATRAAPPDHLGVILCLWAALAEPWPEAALHLSREHLAWAREPLSAAQAHDGFYGRLAGSARSVVDVILAG